MLKKTLSRAAANSRSRRSPQLHVESLETRLQPATLAVASFFDSAVYAVDSNTGALTGTLIPPSSSTVYGIAGSAVGPDGNLYLSSQFGDEIYQYNVTSHALTSFLGASDLHSVVTELAVPSGVFAPSGLAFGPDGDLYVALNAGHSSSSGGAVVRFDVHLAASGIVPSGTHHVVATGLVQPAGLAFGVSANDTSTLYVANSKSQTIVKVADAIAATPTSSTFVNGAPLQMDFPSGLTWGPDGKLYVTDLAENTFAGKVFRFNADGTGGTILPTGTDMDPNTFVGINGSLFLQFPAGVAFDDQSHMLTANLGPAQYPNMAGSINKYDLGGTFISTLIDSSAIPNGPDYSPPTGPDSTGFAPSQIAILPAAPPAIVKDTTAIAGTPTPQTLRTGAASSLTVTVAANGIGGTPTGSVAFSIDGGSPTLVNLAGGQATFNIPPQTAVGVHKIVATYTGDDHHAISTVTTTQTVMPTLVVSSFFDSAVYTIDSSNGALVNTLIPPSSSTVFGIAGMTVGPDGNIYLSSQFGDEVYQYNVASQTLTSFLGYGALHSVVTELAVPSGVFAPSGLAFGPDGDLYVSLNAGHSSASGGAVIRFDVHLAANGLVPTGTHHVVATGLVQPAGLAFGVSQSDRGTLYVANSKPQTIVAIANAISASPVASTFINGTPLQLDFPSGITWGPDGKLYVADLAENTFAGKIMRFNADGSGGTILPTGTDMDPNTFVGINGNLFLQFPAGVAFDGLGHMLTANLGPAQYPNMFGSINQYTLAGSFVSTLVNSFAIPNGPDYSPPTGPDSTGFAPSQIAILPASAPAIVKDTTTITGTPMPASPSTQGQAVALTVTVAANGIGGTPTGSVSFTVDGGTPTTATLTAGQATLNLPSLAVGVHTIVATYSGDDHFAISTMTTSQIVEAAPTVTSVAPFVGPTSGGVTVVITGTSFTTASGVAFGGVSATFHVVSATQITATLPAGAAATVDVVVTNARGSSDPSSASDNFTYASPAILTVVVNGGTIDARNRFGSPLALAGQSSVVEQLLVTFNQRVRVDSGAFSVAGLASAVTSSVATPSGATVAVNAAPVTTSGDSIDGYTQYVLTFAAGTGVNSFDNSQNGGQGNAFTTLKDGLFELQTVGAKIHAGSSDTAANSANRFWSLYGAVSAADITASTALGDGQSTLLVDGVALGQMYATFGSFENAAGPPAYNAAYDWNLDGIVDGIDLGKMYANFGSIWQF